MTETLNRMTVARRLGLSFGAVALILAVVSLLGIGALIRSEAALQHMFVHRLDPVQALGQVQFLTTRNRLLLIDAAADPSPEHVTARLSEFKANVGRMDTLWKAYSASNLDAQERALVDEVHRAREAFREQGLALAGAQLKDGKVDEARATLAGPVSRLGPPLIEAMNRLMEFQIAQANAEKEASRAQSSRSIWLVGGAAGFALLGAGLLAWRGTRAITQALGAEPSQLSAAAERVAQGDLATPVPVRPGDQVSTMAKLAVMRDALVKVVGAVRGNADSVATGSAQIAQGSTDLSQRTEQQASALQQASSTMAQLATTVRDNADHARQANQLAGTASEVAVKGGGIVDQVVVTMRTIHGSSQKIADIIGVIDGIAFQTNILALNAAVEAARAGEQGRGFAVVAAEVRSLAKRSAEAAKEIKTLIQASVGQVEAGSTLVGQAGETMSEIVGAIRQVSDIVAEITTASEAQSRSVGEVGEAVGHMDQATQQNAALVEQSTAAAESLNVQAQELLQAVKVFRLHEGAAA